MEKEHTIMARLDRIDGLRKEDAPAEVLLDEVRLLLAEAEEWVRQDDAAPARAAGALERARETLARRERAAEGSLIAR